MAGSSLLSTAAAMALSTCAFVRPASTNSVVLMVHSRYDYAAAALSRIGTRTLGFQKSGSAAAVHPRATMHTKQFLPFSAVSKP